MAIPRGSYKEKEKGAINNVPKRKHKENTKKKHKENRYLPQRIDLQFQRSSCK